MKGHIRVVVAAVIQGQSTGADSILDVRKNGISMWTNPAHRPTLPAASTQRVFTTYPPDNGTVVPGDIITLVCVQNGSRGSAAMTVAVEEP